MHAVHESKFRSTEASFFLARRTLSQRLASCLCGCCFVQDYLACLYWLLREDFFRPLRDAVCAVSRYGVREAKRRQLEELDGVRVYREVQMGRPIADSRYSETCMVDTTRDLYICDM